MDQFSVFSFLFWRSEVTMTRVFIHNEEKMSGPERSIKITDHFPCTPANVILLQNA